MASSNVILRSQLFWVAVSTVGAGNGATANNAGAVSLQIEKNAAVPAAVTEPLNVGTESWPPANVKKVPATKLRMPKLVLTAFA